MGFKILNKFIIKVPPSEGGLCEIVYSLGILVVLVLDIIPLLRKSTIFE